MDTALTTEFIAKVPWLIINLLQATKRNLLAKSELEGTLRGHLSLCFKDNTGNTADKHKLSFSDFKKRSTFLLLNFFLIAH